MSSTANVVRCEKRRSSRLKDSSFTESPGLALTTSERKSPDQSGCWDSDERPSKSLKLDSTPLAGIHHPNSSSVTDGCKALLDERTETHSSLNAVKADPPNLREAVALTNMPTSSAAVQEDCPSSTSDQISPPVYIEDEMVPSPDESAATCSPVQGSHRSIVVTLDVSEANIEDKLLRTRSQVFQKLHQSSEPGTKEDEDRMDSSLSSTEAANALSDKVDLSHANSGKNDSNELIDGVLSGKKSRRNSRLNDSRAHRSNATNDSYSMRKLSTHSEKDFGSDVVISENEDTSKGPASEKDSTSCESAEVEIKPGVKIIAGKKSSSKSDCIVGPSLEINKKEAENLTKTAAGATPGKADATEGQDSTDDAKSEKKASSSDADKQKEVIDEDEKTRPRVVSMKLSNIFQDLNKLDCLFIYCLFFQDKDALMINFTNRIDSTQRTAFFPIRPPLTLREHIGAKLKKMDDKTTTKKIVNISPMEYIVDLKTGAYSYNHGDNKRTPCVPVDQGARALSQMMKNSRLLVFIDDKNMLDTLALLQRNDAAFEECSIMGFTTLATAMREIRHFQGQEVDQILNQYVRQISVQKTSGKRLHLYSAALSRAFLDITSSYQCDMEKIIKPVGAATGYLFQPFQKFITARRRVVLQKKTILTMRQNVAPNPAGGKPVEAAVRANNKAQSETQKSDQPIESVGGTSSNNETAAAEIKDDITSPSKDGDVTTISDSSVSLNETPSDANESKEDQVEDEEVDEKESDSFDHRLQPVCEEYTEISMPKTSYEPSEKREVIRVNDYLKNIMFVQPIFIQRKLAWLGWELNGIEKFVPITITPVEFYKSYREYKDLGFKFTNKQQKYVIYIHRQVTKKKGARFEAKVAIEEDNALAAWERCLKEKVRMIVFLTEKNKNRFLLLWNKNSKLQKGIKSSMLKIESLESLLLDSSPDKIDIKLELFEQKTTNLHTKNIFLAIQRCESTVIGKMPKKLVVLRQYFRGDEALSLARVLFQNRGLDRKTTKICLASFLPKGTALIDAHFFKISSKEKDQTTEPKIQHVMTSLAVVYEEGQHLHSTLIPVELEPNLLPCFAPKLGFKLHGENYIYSDMVCHSLETALLEVLRTFAMFKCIVFRNRGLFGLLMQALKNCQSEALSKAKLLIMENKSTYVNFCEMYDGETKNVIVLSTPRLSTPLDSTTVMQSKISEAVKERSPAWVKFPIYQLRCDEFRDFVIKQNVYTMSARCLHKLAEEATAAGANGASWCPVDFDVTTLPDGIKDEAKPAVSEIAARSEEKPVSTDNVIGAAPQQKDEEAKEKTPTASPCKSSTPKHLDQNTPSNQPEKAEPPAAKLNTSTEQRVSSSPIRVKSDQALFAPTSGAISDQHEIRKSAKDVTEEEAMDCEATPQSGVQHIGEPVAGNKRPSTEDQQDVSDEKRLKREDDEHSTTPIIDQQPCEKRPAGNIDVSCESTTAGTQQEVKQSSVKSEPCDVSESETTTFRPPLTRVKDVMSSSLLSTPPSVDKPPGDSSVPRHGPLHTDKPDHDGMVIKQEEVDVEDDHDEGFEPADYLADDEHSFDATESADVHDSNATDLLVEPRDGLRVQCIIQNPLKLNPRCGVVYVRCETCSETPRFTLDQFYQHFMRFHVPTPGSSLYESSERLIMWVNAKFAKPSSWE